MSLVGTLASEMGHEINNPLGGLTVAVQMLIKDLESGQISTRGCPGGAAGHRDLRQAVPRTSPGSFWISPGPSPASGSPWTSTGSSKTPWCWFSARPSRRISGSKKQYSLDLPQCGGRPQRPPADGHQPGQKLPGRHARRRPDHHLHLGADDEEGSWVWVGVGDSGPGHTRGDQPDSIFHPFLTTKGRGAGAPGWAWPVSKRIVEEFGGRIGFENKPGVGVEFPGFKLPAEKAAARVELPPARAICGAERTPGGQGGKDSGPKKPPIGETC